MKFGQTVPLIILVLLAVGCATEPLSSIPQPVPPQTEQPTAPEPKPQLPEPKTVTKEVELKYDDGIPKRFISVIPEVNTGGFLVDFAPPHTPFSVQKVLILGIIFGKALEQNYEVELWDKDRSVLYNTQQLLDKFPVSTTLPPPRVWVDVPIPNINVADKFYVHVYTGTGPTNGLQIGADDSIPNEHSSVTTLRKNGDSCEETTWPYRLTVWYSDKSKVNWMIRVIGTYQEK